jgi:hypothetical protein
VSARGTVDVQRAEVDQGCAEPVAAGRNRDPRGPAACARAVFADYGSAGPRFFPARHCARSRSMPQTVFVRVARRAPCVTSQPLMSCAASHRPGRTRKKRSADLVLVLEGSTRRCLAAPPGGKSDGGRAPSIPADPRRGFSMTASPPCQCDEREAPPVSDLSFRQRADGRPLVVPCEGLRAGGRETIASARRRKP